MSNKSVWEIITGQSEHRSGKRKSTWDKHSGAKRNQGSGRPNTKSSVRERRRRNKR